MTGKAPTLPRWCQSQLNTAITAVAGFIQFHLCCTQLLTHLLLQKDTKTPNTCLGLLSNPPPNLLSIAFQHRPTLFSSCCLKLSCMPFLLCCRWGTCLALGTGIWTTCCWTSIQAGWCTSTTTLCLTRANSCASLRLFHSASHTRCRSARHRTTCLPLSSLSCITLATHPLLADCVLKVRSTI